ncbi:hypothetical protein [Jidongwangia harbinensis]|uniref:hypothetical protein n=1 Tax=Jidongwangia harbinensis TaxID=2878561 RepID=UPI001CD98403|nr:hypothetical protein [Jidongwangia harbinensis]MCA2211674.1 hypothetical protein [Jidongwangia harbinensis]
MGRLVFALVALGGIAIATASKQLARAVLISNLQLLSIKIREDGNGYRIAIFLTRALVVTTGLLLLVVGAVHLTASLFHPQ